MLHFRDRVRRLGLSCALLFALAFSAPALADVRYVDDDAAPGGNGQTWATAYNSLQTAIADGKATEILVADGMYHAGDTLLPLRSGLSIVGGFGGETMVGDVGGFSVIGAENVRLARLTITNEDYVALYLVSASIAIRDCRFINCWSVGSGAAILAADSAVSLFGCDFANNASISSGGSVSMLGGSLTAVGCTFTMSISGGSGGGAMALFGGNYTILGCRFTRCLGEGAGAISASGNILIAFCEFVGNRSTMWGGAATSFFGDSRVAIVGCDFRHNKHNQWLHVGGIVQAEDNARAALFGCHFSGNTEPLTLALEQAVITVWP